MIRRLGAFIVGTLAFWGIVVALVQLLWERVGPADMAGAVILVYVSVAAVVCTVPTTVTLLWSSWVQTRSPEQQLLAVMGGTGVRMFFVLAVGMLLTRSVPYFEEHALRFWLCLLVFYFYTLALEMIVLARSTTSLQKQDKQVVRGEQ